MYHSGVRHTHFVVVGVVGVVTAVTRIAIHHDEAREVAVGAGLQERVGPYTLRS